MYVAIPLTRTKTGQLEVTATVNGERARLLVDTGASGTVVDSTSAVRWGLGMAGDADRAVGCGGTMTASAVVIEELQLERLTMRSVPVAVIDFSHTNDALQTTGAARIDGVIGADVLVARQAPIDYGTNQLHLLRSAAGSET
jgi:clan AA aspartic protease (TIGR02281 family)